MFNYLVMEDRYLFVYDQHFLFVRRTSIASENNLNFFKITVLCLHVHLYIQCFDVCMCLAIYFSIRVPFITIELVDCVLFLLCKKKILQSIRVILY